jgi:hypothetical protein
MKIDRLGLMLLLVGEAGLGAWTVCCILDTGNLVDMLRLFSWC